MGLFTLKAAVGVKIAKHMETVAGTGKPGSGLDHLSCSNGVTLLPGSERLMARRAQKTFHPSVAIAEMFEHGIGEREEPHFAHSMRDLVPKPAQPSQVYKAVFRKILWCSHSPGRDLRDALWGLRGQRIGEAAHPGPGHPLGSTAQSDPYQQAMDAAEDAPTPVPAVTREPLGPSWSFEGAHPKRSHRQLLLPRGVRGG